jgi:hypothetical protein
MRLTRRALLVSAVFAATISTRVGRVAAEGMLRAPIALRVFDSRSPLSLAWLGPNRASVIDVAQEQANRWSTLRSSTPTGRVAGLTTWSDYIQVRGSLEQKGKRLRLEARSGGLFYWEMN